jgi:hypothetical protein
VSFLDTAVLFASIVGEALVCGLLLRRKMWRTLPCFCAYVFWNLASDLAASLILWKLSGMSGLIYVRYYFAQTIVDSLLQFAVLVELAWSVLSPVRHSLPRLSLVVLSVLIALAGLAIWPLAGTAVPQNFVGLSVIFFQLQETFAILRVACFLIMASFSQLLSIGWRDRELQIASGLGFYSIISLLVALFHSHQAQGPEYHWPDQALSLSYVGTLSYWTYSFATKEQERKEFSPQMQQFLLLMGGGARAGRIALSDLPSERSRKRNK